DHQQAYNLAANGRTARTEMPAPELLLVVRQEHMKLICGSCRPRSLLIPFLRQFLTCPLVWLIEFSQNLRGCIGPRAKSKFGPRPATHSPRPIRRRVALRLP